MGQCFELLVLLSIETHAEVYKLLVASSTAAQLRSSIRHMYASLSAKGFANWCMQHVQKVCGKFEFE